ncbi:MAG: YraN family protein [Brevefilum sp.]|nr:YraN family protein [Brevefilum sp.]MDT8380883.1 YraN family protein [Brevefilum sp.]MDW7755632.1 YraN family protein [Brevefilum sp.]
MTYQKEIGNKGEKIAVDYLIDKGYLLLDRNYHTRYGELDLVMFENEMIVFVEVKTRTSASFGTPEEGITPSKLDHLQNAGLLWLQAHPESPDDWRIDAVSILLQKNGKIRDIRHFENINL